MSPYGEDSITVHKFLAFALDMAETPEEVQHWFNDNAYVVEQLDDLSKRKILDEYKRRLKGEPQRKEEAMAYEKKEMQGSIFKNPKKQPGDNQPNARGDALIDGRVLKISAWTNVDRNGVPYQKMTFEWEDQSASFQKPAPRKAEVNLDDPWN
jgi:hypothetical protein